MIVRATEKVATTVIGGNTFGRMCRHRIAPSRAPSARAPSTKSRCRSDRVSARAIRA